MDSLAAIIKNTVAELDSEIEITIGGSYRRGAQTSGDIDVMITRAGTNHTSQLLPFLHELVTHLTETGFLVAALAVPSDRPRSDDSGSKWHGACVHPVTPEIPHPIWRRIDLLLVPASEVCNPSLYPSFRISIFSGWDKFYSTRCSWLLRQREKHVLICYSGVLRSFTSPETTSSIAV